MRLAAAALLLLALVAPVAHAADDLVLIREGTLPIILTAPHGGRVAMKDIEPRNSSDSAKVEASRAYGGLSLDGDANTDVLAQGIATEIERLTGKAPYLVMARFTRRYIDANRPAKLAYDDPKAQPTYDLYHGAIRRFVDEVSKKYPAGLLIDVHGQAKDSKVVMRGTNNGRTVAKLIKRAGESAVVGPDGVFGQLEAKGFAVFPPNSAPPSGTHENAGYNGGYTVSLYGSNRPNGIDAVQFEFGTKYRVSGSTVERYAKGAAAALVAFHDAYLKAP